MNKVQHPRIASLIFLRPVHPFRIFSDARLINPVIEYVVTAQQPVFVSDLIDHYLVTELSEQTNWHAHSTRMVYRVFIKRWIRPRTIQSRVRYEWLEQGRNPIKLVRQSTLRKRTPTVLEPHELQNLLSQLESPFQLMVLLAVTAGLRRSELFALKWGDLDFSNLTIDIQRSIYMGKIGSCKTAASKTSTPLPLFVAAELWTRKETTRYAAPDDWIFASPRSRGRKPFYPDM